MRVSIFLIVILGLVWAYGYHYVENFRPAYNPEQERAAGSILEEEELPAGEVTISEKLVVIEEPVKKIKLPEPEPEVYGSEPSEQELAALQQQLDAISDIVAELESGVEKATEQQIEVAETVEEQKSEVNAPISTNYEKLVEQLIHERTNQERVDAGLWKLSYDENLAAVAKNHSIDMANRDYFEHTDPDGCNVTCRLEKVGFEGWLWGENLAWQQATFFPSEVELADDFIQGWLNSPGHKENMLREGFTHEGVGVFRIGNQAYATVVFAKPK